MTTLGHLNTGDVPESWLKERLITTDVHELAKHELADSGVSDVDMQRLLAVGLSPRWMEKWHAFIGQMVADDELWFFESPAETWNRLAGRTGYALVRSGHIVASIFSGRS